MRVSAHIHCRPVQTIIRGVHGARGPCPAQASLCHIRPRCAYGPRCPRCARSLSGAGIIVPYPSAVRVRSAVSTMRAVLVRRRHHYAISVRCARTVRGVRGARGPCPALESLCHIRPLCAYGPRCAQCVRSCPKITDRACRRPTCAIRFRPSFGRRPFCSPPCG